jgi:hypothetical protein
MAINQINGFNPYTQSIGTQAPLLKRDVNAPKQSDTSAGTAGVQENNRTLSNTRLLGNENVTNGKYVADAIKQSVTERMAQVHSGQAPEGVDQDLWSILTKEERMFFVKTGAMGGLTYGRGANAAGASAMPIARGGRLDIRV